VAYLSGNGWQLSNNLAGNGVWQGMKKINRPWRRSSNGIMAWRKRGGENQRRKKMQWRLSAKNQRIWRNQRNVAGWRNISVHVVMSMPGINNVAAAAAAYQSINERMQSAISINIRKAYQRSNGASVASIIKLAYGINNVISNGNQHGVMAA